jgi:hypothetical protein
MLIDFDLDSRYGPALGLTRRERYHAFPDRRFNRALKYGLHPPLEIESQLEAQPTSIFATMKYI